MPPRRRAPSVNGDQKLPQWAGEKLVVCEGGPKDGQWFFLADWEHMVRAAKRMADVEEQVPPVLQYVATKDVKPHPDYPTLFGFVAKHSTAAIRRQAS
jgi:hypothetical protein